ncbi:hypothetical protein HYW94_01555 [Candidatus Uhrbacteria bacterium]|nr:hypothetical protein [Candidatus Uhrbacteria bacterium]
MEEQHFSEGEGGAQETHSSKKQDQRPLVGLFILLFAGISIFGLQGITKNIQYPFARKDGSKPLPVQQLSKDEQKEKTDEVLKNADTDKDGLNDFDEITIYRTSAFLDDSDGDGYDDKTELRTGHDPLCDESKRACGNIQSELFNTSASTSTENIPKLSGGLLGGQAVLGGQAQLPLPAVTIPGFDTPMTIEDLRNLSPQEIRAFLVRQGMSEKDLKNVDDTALKNIYGQVFESTYEKVIKEQEARDQSTPSIPQAVQPAPSQPFTAQEQFDPNAMSPDQLRDLLRKTGRISEEDLKRIDDATLKTLAKQAYQEVKQ